MDKVKKKKCKVKSGHMWASKNCVVSGAALPSPLIPNKHSYRKIKTEPAFYNTGNNGRMDSIGDSSSKILIAKENQLTQVM